MRVCNTSGIPQYAPRGSLFPPGTWMKVPEEVNLFDAVWMHTHRLGNLADITDDPSLTWRDKHGTYHLYWLSPFSLGDGYATAAENLVHALVMQGVDLEIHQCWFYSVDGLRPETVEMLNAPMKQPHRVGLCMATPGEFKKLPTPYRIGLTMYEADDPLHNLPEWRHDCADVDQIIVPSEYCKGVFEEFVKVPVDVTPLPVHPSYFCATEREPKDTFKFITFGTLSGRKAPLETLDAFKKAFPIKEYPDVTIEFKTRLGYFGWGENQLPDFQDDPRVRIVSADWYVPEMLEWMLGADCMIFASKGEGFGMPPREAMATGLPVILSKNTGLLEVCNGRYNWPIPTGHVEDSPLGGNWRIPDWDFTIDAMRDIYHNRERAYHKGYLGAKWFEKNWSTERVGHNLLDILAAVDPNDSAERHAREQTWFREKVTRHKEFADWCESKLAPNSVVWDVTVGDGKFFKMLADRGFQMHAVVDANDVEATKHMLARLGVTPNVIAFSGDHLHEGVLRRTRQRPAAIVSYLDMQQYGDNDIRLRLEGMLKVTERVLFNVPSVYFPEFYKQGARLMRPAQWMDILKNFAAVIKPYTGTKDYLKVEVREAVGAVAVRMNPRQGRVLQGVWHPN